MKIQSLLLFLILIPAFIYAGDKPAYKLFTSKGKEVSWKKMVKELSGNDMVFFGELHDNPIAHWLEYELFISLYQIDSNMVAGAEMFESDNQKALNEYLAGNMDENKLKDEARLWKNFKTDYKPLVDFARDNSIPFIATNVPRRYASAVFKGDFSALDSLGSDELQWIAPLPILFDLNVACYNNMLKMGEEHGMKVDEKYPKAQALKDATMAHFILMNHRKDNLFFHINGSYHSENHEGIIWYLRKADPSISIKSIATVEQDQIRKLQEDHKGKADFLIAVPSTMTKTY